jgi:hypothetical protein
MDMMTPPLMIDLPTEIAAEVDERDRGLLGEARLWLGCVS